MVRSITPLGREAGLLSGSMAHAAQVEAFRFLRQERLVTPALHVEARTVRRRSWPEDLKTPLAPGLNRNKSEKVLHKTGLEFHPLSGLVTSTAVIAKSALR